MNLFSRRQKKINQLLDLMLIETQLTKKHIKRSDWDMVDKYLHDIKSTAKAIKKLESQED